MNYRINKIPKNGIEHVKKVLVYFNGTFPKKAYPLKDTNLPVRIFPNAEIFYIRCKNCKENLDYFTKLYKGKKIKFIPETFDDWVLASEKTDAMYMPWCGFDGYQKTLGDFKVRFHKAMMMYKNPIYLFINEPSCGSFRSIHEYATNSCKNDSLKKELLNLPTSYGHVNFMPNDTPFKSQKYWWESKVEPVSECIDITVTPIPDNIIYDLPTSSELIEKFNNKEYDKKRGIWLGTCFDSRVKYFNDTFKTEELLDLEILGRGTEDVELYSKKFGDTNIDNSMLPKIFSEHEWSIYISRGKFTNMLGATFYEPILNGLPQFISIVCDPNKEIFPGINCYFSNEHELKELIQNHNLKELWLNQVNYLL